MSFIHGEGSFLAKEDVLPYMFLSFPLENGKESHEEILVLRKAGERALRAGLESFSHFTHSPVSHVCEHGLLHFHRMSA